MDSCEARSSRSALAIHQFVAQEGQNAERQHRAERDQNSELMDGHRRLAGFQTPKTYQWERKQSRRARRDAQTASLAEASAAGGFAAVCEAKFASSSRFR